MHQGAAYGGPVVHLDLATRAELLRARSGGAVLSDRRAYDGRVLQRIELGDDGYVFEARGWGVFRISADGLAVRCAPVRMATWRWQRYLVGQLLPFVALLRGYEVFHASVLTQAEATVAFVGPSGAGKSSLSTALQLRGWQLVADDVLVVEISADDDVIAHPATALTNLRHDAAARFSPSQLHALGEVIGQDEEALRIITPTTGEPRRLTHLYVLARRDEGPPAEPMEPVDPKVLLAATFNFLVQTPERLLRQLDVCHRIANRVAIGNAFVTPEHGPNELAHHIERHVATFTAR